MDPITIADSDDESDSNKPIVAPSLVTVVPQAQARSPEQGSLATASTDSALFQQIFNEQNAAASERALQLQLQQELEDSLHQSSAMTVPDVPFQRTTKGFYHSSLTSVTDPHSERSRNYPSIRSPEKTQERTQSVVDPWKVPSSPEAPKLLEEQSKHHRDESALGADISPENSWDDLEIIQGRDKKRRRLDQVEAALSQSNDLDLIMPPHESKLIISHDELETIDDTNSVFYQQDSAAMDNSPSHNAIPEYNGLLLKQQTQYAVGSSGSATNVNTPRSQLFSPQSFGSKAPEEQESTTATKKIEYRNFVSRRGSSPDIISAPAPDPDVIAPKSPDLKPKSEADKDPLAPEESDAEFVARPTPAVKSRKKRGRRPKKALEADEPLPIKAAESPTPAADAMSPVPTGQKKGRGRPKKQADEPAAESAPLAADIPTPVASAGGKKAGGKKASGKKKTAKGQKKIVVLSDSEGDHSATENLAAENVGEPDGDEDIPKSAPAKDDQIGAPSKKSKTTDSPCEIIPDDKSKDEVEAKDVKQRATKEEKSSDKKGLSALGLAKPIYRVGLSKRSRIAPLLKSVRKT